MTTVRLRFWIWSALMLVMVGVCVATVLPRLRIETDILALLPSDDDAFADRAVNAFSQHLARKQIFLIGASSSVAAKSAANRFVESLRNSGTFKQVDLTVTSHAFEQLELYKAHRYYLLSERQLSLLRDGTVEALQAEALRAAYTPAGLMRPLSIAEDPLGLAADFLLQQIPAMGAARLEGGVLMLADNTHTFVIVLAELAGSPFATTEQERVMPAIEAAKIAAQEALPSEERPSFKFYTSGVIQHADAAARRATAEISTFGTIETILVLVLLLIVFGALRPLLLGALAFTLAGAAGLTVVHLIFGRVHILALVFGSSLIGGVIDYSIHFFADRFRDPEHWTPASAVDHVGGAILLGLTTTLLGYAVLVLVPFPGLRQIAVFCIAGLVVGCGTVLCIYPMLTRWRRKAPPFGPRVGASLDRFMLRWQWTRPRIAVAIAIAGLALIGLTRIQIQDDVRALQSSPANLLDSERAVAGLLKTAVESRFFLVRDSTSEGLLEREERLTTALDEVVRQGRLNSYTALSRSLPSLMRQNEIHRLLAQDIYSDAGLLPGFMRRLGFPAGAIVRRQEDFAAATGPLTPEAWLASPASDGYRSLWLGKVGEHYASVVTLGGVKDVAALEQVATSVPGVKLIDKVHAVTDVLKRYREAMSRLLVAVYVVAGLMLATRFGWRDALRLLMPSIAATTLTLGLFGWFNVPVNLFTLLALWLVLGLGVDYGIFLRHGRTARTTAILSVTLSAFTTLIAFGLLAFSATPFIRSIGLTLLLAITFSWLFVMFSCLTSFRVSKL